MSEGEAGANRGETNGGHLDAVIIGGGPVGAAAALELHASGFSVLLLEARATRNETGGVPVAATSHPALRPLAISHGSRLVLERLGVWEALPGPTPISRIHVSQLGRFGRTVITATEAELPALGYVVDYARLTSALDRAVAGQGVPARFGARVTSIAHEPGSARVAFESAVGPAECSASVVLVADGAAAATGIDVRVTDYGQSALTALVESDTPQDGTAYERFTPEGPLALLPCGRGYAVVWTMTPPEAERLCDAAPETFLSELERRFGGRVARLKAVDRRAAQRVSLRVAARASVGRAVLIGNAAQALHPVAGQGFNLGLRDAWELAVEMRRRGAGDERLLEAYVARRRVDRAGSIGFTHALVKIFSNDWLPLAAARGAGLTILDCLPPAKDFVVRRMVFGARG